MFWVILIGFFTGIVAKFLMPGPDPGGFIVTTILGMGGAWLASWIVYSMGFYPQGESYSFVAAVLGAIAILFLYRVFNSKRAVVL